MIGCLEVRGTDQCVPNEHKHRFYSAPAQEGGEESRV